MTFKGAGKEMIVNLCNLMLGAIRLHEVAEEKGLTLAGKGNGKKRTVPGLTMVDAVSRF